MSSEFDPQATLDALLGAAREAGAHAAEASLSAHESTSAEVRLGALEGVEREEGRSIALRAFIGRQQAGASTTDLSRSGLRELAARVLAMAKEAPEDQYCGLLDPIYAAKPGEDLDLFDNARPSPEALLELAFAAEAEAMAQKGVANSAGAGASFSTGLLAYAATTGFYGVSRGTSYGLSAQPIAERDGKMERDYEYRSERHFADLPSPEEIGRIAGERAGARLGARKLESQRAAVIFENRLAGRMIGPFLGAISGPAVARGVSFLKDKLGEAVFAPDFELWEDPFLKRGAGSHTFDGEGGAVRKQPLIEAGRIVTWLHNAASARQLGMKPTGHATLGHGGPPGVSTSNLRITPGLADLPGLMREAGRGLVVTEMFSPSLNANTGDWSVGCAGYWFEGGERAFPVSEITVAGNLLDIFKRLRAGGDVDRRGALESPSLFVDDLAIGGI